MSSCSLDEIFYLNRLYFKQNQVINPFQPSVTFHVETRHLIFSANLMTGFYIECNTELKWVKYSEIEVVKYQ